MHRPIDPKVDCVFKTLLGSDDHRDLLIHFLNAAARDDLPAPSPPSTSSTPTTSARPSTTSSPSSTSKRSDAGAPIFQVEIQLLVFPSLAPRILYTWADLLQPAVAQRRGLRARCNRSMRSGSSTRPCSGSARVRPSLHRLRDDRGRPLDRSRVRPRFRVEQIRVEPVETDAERWLKFLKDGEQSGARPGCPPGCSTPS